MTTIAGSAPGTAGAASANVVTVQGVTSMTPVQVSQATASSLNATVIGAGAAGTANAGVVTVQGIAAMTPILTNPGTAANYGVGATGSAVPANAVYDAINVGGNLRGATGVNPSGTVYAVQTDVTSVNGVTVLTGTGAVGTGAQRVAVGTDTATIAGSAPGPAGTPSASVVTVQGVTSMTPVQVSQATASNLKATVDVLGNGGATMDVAQGGATAATNALQVAGVYNSSPITLTTGQAAALQFDVNGNAKVVGQGIAQGSTTSGEAGSLIFGAVTSTGAGYSAGYSNPLTLDTNGYLKVNVVAGGASGGASQADNSAFSAGSGNQNPVGCLYNTGTVNLTSANVGVVRCDIGRNLIVAGEGTAGSAAGGVMTVQGQTSMTPVQVSQATAANLNAAVVGLGSAGSPSGGVLSIQGVTGGTGVPVTGTFYQATQPVSIASAQVVSGAYASGSLASGAVVDLTNVTGTKAAGTAATKSLLGGAVYTAAGITLTDGQQAALQVNSTGALLVSGSAGGTSLADNAAWSVGSTAMTPAGCEYTSGGATAITTAHAGTVGCTTGRAIFTDKSSVAGTAITAVPTAVGTLGSGNVETVNAAVSPISGSVFQIQSNSANLATVANQPTNSAIGDATTAKRER